MATTIENAPNDLSLAADPVVFDISAPNAFAGSGTNSRLRIRITSYGPSVNDTFTLEYNGIEQTFTIKTSPDTSGRQLRDGTGMSSTLEYAERLVEDFKKNYYLFRDFIITYAYDSGDCVQFVARDMHPNYDLTLTESLAWMTEQDNTAGVSTQLEDNHKVILALLIESTFKSASFDTILELESSVYNTGTLATTWATFNVGQRLIPYMTLPLPDYDLAAIDEINENVLRFKVYHAEKFGDPILADEVTEESDIYTVINGGSSHPFRFNYADIEADWLTNNKWLTWEPDGKTIALDQVEYLWFMSLASQTAYCFIKIYYTDSTVDDWQEFDDSGALTAYDVICVPVGVPDVISTLADGNKTIQKFKVRLASDSGNTTQIAEDRTFVVAQTSPLDRKFIHYYNSFGVLETKLFYAQTERKSKVESIEYIGGNTITDDATVGRAGALPGAEDRTFSLVTPILSRAQADHLREFMFSQKHYIIEGGERLPVVLLTRELTTWEKGKSGNSYEFKFMYSIRNTRHSA